MTFSTSGPMIQLYVLEALRIYSEQIIESDYGKTDDGKSMINPVAWRRCAVEVLERINNRT